VKLLVVCVIALLSRSHPAAATTILYLNSCEPSGCVVAPGATDARTDQSDLVLRVHQLTPWRYGPSTWSAVVNCVRSVMSPFDIQVTDVDPGTADHLEVMVAGTSQQLGADPTIGGLADLRCAGVGDCSPSIPNALAFVFADVWNGNVTETCASAAQQIGHTWALDHVIDPQDPMSVIRAGAGTPAFRDGQVCGSDCVAGFSQFGLACTGTGSTATHTCVGTGQATQDEVATILAVVGPAQTQPPTLAFRAPVIGAVAPGFTISVDCTSNDDSTVAGVDFTLDGDILGHVDAAPFELAAPADVAIGTHTLTATCATNLGTASRSTTISVGAACTTDRDCTDTDVCDAGACIPGSNADGGLGTVCKTSSDCASQICASEGWGKTYCVVECTTDAPSCPAGFACFASSGQAGACWAVEGGGCDASNGNHTCAWLMLAIVSIHRSRRRARPADSPR